MKLKTMKKAELLRFILMYCALAFCFVSLILALVETDSGKVFMSLISVLYVFIPNIAEKLFKFRIQTSLYVFIAVYTICPLLGYSYDMYYRVHWWDDMLHGFAGLIFAMLGAYLPYVLSKKKRCSVALCAFCAFFFSVAVSGLWELVEYATDTLFRTDMQKDTVLSELRPSYVISELLGGAVGELTPIDDVQIVVNGQVLGHYVDFGLLDSMNDMLVETVGAAIYTVIYVFARGKHFVFLPVGKTPEMILDTTPLSEEECEDEETEQEAAISATETEGEI